ncbi:MAG: four helix bundle suffix domain-containing protein [Bacteroidaceae bacterium]|nr:four helix bundle suffix domain-containing protein [Bacteroidaceae bacterium]MBQ9176961.1 four helix bundle suffix domain-containing protein [Bacteroidaceae bacterium]MBR1378629.1 four helix bundle suffix domain-containing protein [Bacteroidaceae bacterium]
MEKDNNASPILRRQPNWEDLYFYQKAVVLYQLTFVFTKRFLTKGDRTIDQMVQAARSGKQNIVEGSADGVTSTEMELKLLNVARSSIKELKEDYEDYITSRHLQRWNPGHERYDGMLRFCRHNNRLEQYQTYFERWTDEEMANIALTLCHMVDRMMTTYQKQLEETFVKEGGIKERMTAARLGYRTNQREEIERLKHELEAANQRIAYLEAKLRQQGQNY